MSKEAVKDIVKGLYSTASKYSYGTKPVVSPIILHPAE
jgi:hypothetical protein